jgi:hypothetical protein
VGVFSQSRAIVNLLLLSVLNKDNLLHLESQIGSEIATLVIIIPHHGRRSRTQSKELQHEQDPEQGYQAGNACANVSV